MAESIRIIKKYQNRKLYDTQDSCYVTLDGIAKMIRDGEDIVVIDNNTKVDVTALILTQVLYEQEKTNQSVLPVEILKNIVKAGSNNLYEFLQKFVMGSIQAQLKTQQELQAYVDRMVQKGELNTSEAQVLVDQIRKVADTTRGSLDRIIDERLTQYIGGRTTAANNEVSVSDYSNANRAAAIEHRVT